MSESLAAVPEGDLLADTTLTPDPNHPGRFHGEISSAWQIQYAFGGVTMTAALRALQQAIGREDLQLVTANAIFCAPIPCGPIVADVSILRNGRTAAQVACDLRVPGDDTIALRAHGVFGKPHDTDLAFVDIPFPDDVAMPDDCEPPPERGADDSPFPPVNFHRQTDFRSAVPGIKRPWDEDFVGGGPARFAAWTRLFKEPRLPDGTYDPIALGLPADSIGPAIGFGLGPGRTPSMSLSLEIGLRFIQVPTTTPAWILQDMRCWQCGDGYATGPTHLWDTEGNLLAIAQQTAHLRAAR